MAHIIMRNKNLTSGKFIIDNLFYFFFNVNQHEDKQNNHAIKALKSKQKIEENVNKEENKREELHFY